MEIIKDPEVMQKLCLDLKKKGETIGLVPTMGALHEGHLSLLKAVRKLSAKSVMSIYLNPAQFAPGEDLDRYPRNLEEDARLTGKYGCDYIFAPSDSVMYPDPYFTWVSVENLSGKLEGAARPDHFRGVTTIVLKLFNIITPDIAVFGRKDAQQAIILRRMAVDLNLPVKLMISPIVREKDGLAMSSRNSYLTEREREEAPAVFRGLQKAKDAFENGERKRETLTSLVENEYRKCGCIKVEYIELVDTVFLDPVGMVDEKALLAAAVRTDESNTRLIDNMVLGGEL